MNITKTVRQAAIKSGKDIPETVIRKIVSTIRTAGDLPIDLMLDLINEEISKYGKQQQRTNEGTQEHNEETFTKVDAALENGTCPICGQKMSDVKLADYTPAKYCTGECRVTLWSKD